MRSPEHNLQVACVNWFDLQHPRQKKLLFAIPNGGNRNIVTAKKLKAEGVKSGVFDLFLSIPREYKGVLYHGLYIELKSPEIKKPKLSKNQKEFCEVVEEEGYLTLLCNDFDKFCKFVNEYLKKWENK